MSSLQSKRIRCFSFLLLLLCCQTQLVIAQEDNTNDLTNGLLELLKEPPEKDAGQPEPETHSPETAKAEPKGQHDSPLSAIHQNMASTTSLLNQGITGATTQTLQNNIIVSLDQLIQQLEQEQDQQQNSASSSKNDSQSSSKAQEQSQQPKQQQSTQNAQNQDSKSEPKDSNSPGNQGGVSAANAGLVTNRSLQEQVWGQLPERVRKQMRSTMVEQFLPSFRDQIQGYFEALLKED